MEKRKPSHSLQAIKNAFSSADRLVATKTAIDTAAALGFDRADIVATIQLTERKDFVKSMTSLADHREWQDVYNVPIEGFVIYLKFRSNVLTGFQLLSFKEK
jgi:motility quorum-sensing regulator / GCU-specific mRNA interferase toxin